MITVHAREALLIKQSKIPIAVRDEIIDKYRFRFYETKACEQCEFYEERMAQKDQHLEVCDQCAAFKGGADLAAPVIIGKTRYIKTPIGDALGLKKLLDKRGIAFKFKKHFPTTMMKRQIKFTGTLKDYQPAAVTAMVKKKRGILKAPPRSGKTVMAAAAICKIGRKTIIMASQREWLLGFKETFIGSPTQKALTNCRESQIGFARTYEDFLKYDICLVTVQTFYSAGGERLLRKIRDLCPVIVVDEVHTSAAPKYAKVLASLNCEYKLGLSGTPDRKDGRMKLTDTLMGPWVADIKVERLRPHVRLVRTGFVANYKGQVPWVRMVSALEKDPHRLKLIAQWAIRDAKNGHMVLIPFAQVTPIKALVMAINKLAGKELAFPFYGGLKKRDRDLYIENARKYKAKILVGNIKLLSTGTNIPRASALYETTLSSNAPNAEQRFSRILTPYDGKPQPIIRFFLDNTNVRRRCMSFEFYKVLKPSFKPVISETDSEVMKSYLANKDKSMARMEL